MDEQGVLRRNSIPVAYKMPRTVWARGHILYYLSRYGIRLLSSPSGRLVSGLG